MFDEVETHLNNIRTDIETFLAESRETERRLNEAAEKMLSLEPNIYFPKTSLLSGLATCWD